MKMWIERVSLINQKYVEMESVNQKLMGKCIIDYTLYFQMVYYMVDRNLFLVFCCFFLVFSQFFEGL